MKIIRQVQQSLAAFKTIMRGFSFHTSGEMETIATKTHDLTQKRKNTIWGESFLNCVTPFLSIGMPMMVPILKGVEIKEKSESIKTICQAFTASVFKPQQLDFEHQGKLLDLFSQHLNRMTQAADQLTSTVSGLEQEIQSLEQKAQG